MRLLKLVAILSILVTSVIGQYSAAPNKKLTIQYVANEGVMITSGDTQILLDAIHRSYQPAYAFTPEPILSKIEGGRHPYGNIDLVLVSHHHLDHFNAESVARHVINNRGVKIVSSEQVIDEVKAATKKIESETGLKKATENQFKALKHEWKKTESFELGDTKIRFLGLLHANSKVERYRKIQNFGHIIEIAGKKLLHVGDADMMAENFSAFELAKEDLDVAFVPYWYVLSKEGREIMKTQIRAKTYIAVHVPPTGRSGLIRDILGKMPSAMVFSESGEMLNY